MRLNKRGQITPFIIVGIIIVIVAVLIFVYRPELRRGLTTTQISPIQTYIEDCIKEKLSSDLGLLRGNGGKFDLSYYKQERSGKSFNYLLYKGGYETPNMMNTLGFIQDELSIRIRDRLEKNCPMDSFKSRYNLEIGEISNINTKIGEHVVSVIVNYPIIINKGENEVKLDKFSIDYEDDFGKIYEIVEDIISFEDKNGVEYDCNKFISNYEDYVLGGNGCADKANNWESYYEILTKNDKSTGKKSFDFVTRRGIPS